MHHQCDPGDEAVVGSAECQTALFVKELKTFETVSCDLGKGKSRTETVIVAFDLERLGHALDPKSPNYKPSLHDFDSIASEIFKKGEAWATRGLVKAVMDLLHRILRFPNPRIPLQNPRIRWK